MLATLMETVEAAQCDGKRTGKHSPLMLGSNLQSIVGVKPPILLGTVATIRDDGYRLDWKTYPHALAHSLNDSLSNPCSRNRPPSLASRWLESSLQTVFAQCDGWGQASKPSSPTMPISRDASS